MSKFEEMKDYFERKTNFQPELESMEDVKESVKIIDPDIELDEHEDDYYLELVLRTLGIWAFEDFRYDDAEEIAGAMVYLDML